MRLSLAVFVLACAAQVAVAHGPQIQINVDGGKIVTRELFLDGDYSDALTAPKSVYVMPLLDYDFNFNGNFASSPRPNNVDYTLAGNPEFYSGPGVAYGYGWTAGNEPFAAGSKFGLEMIDSLTVWSGAGFVDAGAAEFKSYTGSNPYTTTNSALSGAAQALQFPTGTGITYTAGDEVEAHATVRYQYLSDGTNPASAPDGVYMLKLKLTHPQSGVESDPFYYVMGKNSPEQLTAAVRSLGFDSNAIQYIVPEPNSVLLSAIAASVMTLTVRRRTRK